MRRFKKNNFRFMKRIKSIPGIVFLFIAQFIVAQQEVSFVNNTKVAQSKTVSDTTKTFKRIKVDGVAAVIGDYIILESDVDQTLLDLQNQGVSLEQFNRCQLLGKLMEDKLYAHHAVQDSILISDAEISNVVSAKVDYLVRELGTIEKVLKFYRKSDEESFKRELFEIEKARELAERMQAKILEEVEITPEEIREWFSKIPKSELPVFGAELEIAQIVKQPKVSKEEEERIVNRLKEFKRDVVDNGASFSTKAILYSKDEASRPKGGFYELTKKTPFLKEFKDVAFSLKQGEVSDPFETIYGWHIVKVEKIRGQERDIRHILLVPEVSDQAMKEAREELNTIRKRIDDGELTFAEAAKEFSDQKETKFDGGVLRNPVNFDTRFELTKMDPTLYNQVRNLKDNEISVPVIQVNERTGDPEGYKILRVTNRFDEHTADFSKDYLKIRDLALKDKQRRAIEKWTAQKIKDTYISISRDNRECDFNSNWVKK